MLNSNKNWASCLSFNFEKVEKVWESKILYYNFNLHNVPFPKLYSTLNSDQNWASYSSLKFEKVWESWENLRKFEKVKKSSASGQKQKK